MSPEPAEWATAFTRFAGSIFLSSPCSWGLRPRLYAFTRFAGSLNAAFFIPFARSLDATLQKFQQSLFCFVQTTTAESNEVFKTHETVIYNPSLFKRAYHLRTNVGSAADCRSVS